MITDEILQNNGIDKLLNNINSTDIPLLDVIKIDNTTYGRMDIIINRYYNGNMLYINLLMSFNKITDPIEMKLGMIFELPDFDILLSQLSFNTILDDDIIPGINKTTDSKKLNKEALNLKTTATKTTALPKLKITKNVVSYDSSTGIIKY